MVLSGMNLSDCPANAWPVVSDHDEQVLGYKPQFVIHLHDLNVGESLAIGANFILTFDDQYTPFPQDAPRFTATIPVQVQYGFMVLASGLVA